MRSVAVAIGVAAAVLALAGLSDVLSVIRVAVGGRRRRRRASPPREPPRLLFMVPAHDEQVLVGSCVRSLLAQDYPRDRLAVTVIADNCTDRTAAIARRWGARTLERRDPARPGKPRAIAWALARTALTEHDALVIVDADSEVDRGFARALAGVSMIRRKAGQAYFDVANPGDSALTRMAAVLAAANHGFAYRLKRAAGLNVPLVGNGMWLGCGILAEHGWNAFSICEDWELYASLTASGVVIEGVPEARLRAQETRTLRQSDTQRQRWTAGRLAVLGRYATRLLWSRHAGARQKLDCFAELSAPGPALHLALAALLAATAWFADVPGALLLTVLLGAGLVRPALCTAAALAVNPEPLRALAAFAQLPAYALWRLGAGVRALRMLGSSTPWVRTQRHVPGAT